jgi:hypothetical protein
MACAVGYINCDGHHRRGRRDFQRPAMEGQSREAEAGSLQPSIRDSRVKRDGYYEPTAVAKTSPSRPLGMKICCSSHVNDGRLDATSTHCYRSLDQQRLTYSHQGRERPRCSVQYVARCEFPLVY